MPYIPQEDRDRLGKELSDYLLDGKGAYNAGQLNFVFTLILKKYLGDKMSYQKINDVVGALEGAKAEFQRRLVQDYENSKIDSNGDVY